MKSNKVPAKCEKKIRRLDYGMMVIFFLLLFHSLASFFFFKTQVKKKMIFRIATTTIRTVLIFEIIKLKVQSKFVNRRFLKL